MRSRSRNARAARRYVTASGWPGCAGPMIKTTSLGFSTARRQHDRAQRHAGRGAAAYRLAHPAEIEPPATSAPIVVTRRQDDADCATQDDSTQRELSASANRS